jgi:dimethylaniline monooxygenase (N-oxide forming)
MKVKTVAIIGGGLSGIASAKSIQDEGMLPTIFEKKDEIGGVWRKHEGLAWSTMHTNVSKYFFSFYDHLWPSSNTKTFPSTVELNEYIVEYVKKYKLETVIRCNSDVINAMQIDKKRWLIRWKCTLTGKESYQIFDYLIYCVGTCSNAYMPEFETSNLYKGKVIHSIHYASLLKTCETFKDKKVLVIGHSSSGVEISSDLVERDANVTNIFNSPHWVIKKNITVNTYKGEIIMPFDFLLVNRKVFQIMKEKKTKTELFQYQNRLMSILCRGQNTIPELNIDPNSTRPIHYTISENYLDYVHKGKIIPKKVKIKSFTETGVIYENGKEESADIVIFCTGYKYDFDIFDEDVLKKLEYNPKDIYQPVITYKGTLPLDVENLAFVGLVKEPALIFIELQARWVSKLFNGKVKLPDRQKFITGLNKERLLRDCEYRAKYSRFSNLPSYTDEISEEINSKPDFEKINTEDPSLYKILQEGPLCCQQYRLNDDYANAVAYINVIGRVLERLLNNIQTEE